MSMYTPICIHRYVYTAYIHMYTHILNLSDDWMNLRVTFIPTYIYIRVYIHIHIYAYYWLICNNLLLQLKFISRSRRHFPRDTNAMHVVLWKLMQSMIVLRNWKLKDDEMMTLITTMMLMIIMIMGYWMTMMLVVITGMVSSYIHVCICIYIIQVHSLSLFIHICVCIHNV